MTRQYFIAWLQLRYHFFLKARKGFSFLQLTPNLELFKRGKRHIFLIILCGLFLLQKRKEFTNHLLISLFPYHLLLLERGKV